MNPQILFFKFCLYHRRQLLISGFTLIELLVVIIIIGILSAIALPAMLSQGAKARQSEAKTYIGMINRAQQSYLVEKLEFTDNIEQLGIGIDTETNYYSYSFVKQTTQGSVVARPTSETETKAYSGAATLFVDRAILKTIICETKAPGTNGLNLPSWSEVESTLVCPDEMKRLFE